MIKEGFSIKGVWMSMTFEGLKPEFKLWESTANDKLWCFPLGVGTLDKQTACNVGPQEKYFHDEQVRSSMIQVYILIGFYRVQVVGMTNTTRDERKEKEKKSSRWVETSYYYACAAHTRRARSSMFTSLDLRHKWHLSDTCWGASIAYILVREYSIALCYLSTSFPSGSRILK